MLRTLVNCNGKAIVSNQAECCLQIFENKHVWKKLIFKTRKNSGGVIEVYVSDYQKWIVMEQFNMRSDIKDHGKIYNYFTAMVLLCSDLCLDRNFIGIHHLQHIYPFQVCYDIINKNFETRLSYAFVRLIITLWVDLEFTKIVLPNKIRVWDTLSLVENKIKTNNSTYKYEILKSFITQYIRNIINDESQHIQRTYFVDQNLHKKAVLQLLKKMLEFGFYLKVEETKEII